MQDVSFFQKLGEAFGKHKAREGFTEEPKFDWDNSPEFEGLTEAQQVIVEDAAKLAWSQEWSLIRVAAGKDAVEKYGRLNSSDAITVFARHIGRVGRPGTNGSTGPCPRLLHTHH